MRKFWKKTEGFTLVELIVVIAILGILAGVGTVGYSGYIKKANMAADEQLIRDIEYALTLAYYNGTIGDDEQGRIILSTERTEVAPDESKLNEAMNAIYGVGNWENLTLKHDSWDLSAAADSTMMGYVEGSNFDTENMESLLNSVQYVTDEFAGWWDSNSFTPSPEMQAYFDGLNIDNSDTQAKSNATVLYVGNMFAKTNATEQEIADAWMSGDYTNITGDNLISGNAAKYAATLAMATYIEEKNNLSDKPYTNRLIAAKGSAILDAMENVGNDIGSEYTSDMLAYYGFSSISEMGNGVKASSEAFKDAMAFRAYMSGMTSASDALLKSTDIGSSNYYADGTVHSFVDNYIQTSEDLNTAGVTNGVVVCIFNGVPVHFGTAE